MDNNFGNGNYDPNQNPLNMTGGQPMDAGMTQPVNTGFNQPMDAGMTQPVDAGMTQPVNTGFNQPMDAGMTQPVNTGFNQPMDAGMTQPVNTGFNQPINTGMTQPVDTGMTQPVSPDMSSQFAQINQQNMQQFGGQTMNNFGNSQFNQPMNTAQTGGKKPKKPKKPLSGGAIAGIITACAAVVALVVCGIIFLPKIIKSPKERVKEAFEKTFESADKDDAKDFSKKLVEEGGEIKISANIENYMGQDLPADFSVDVIYAPADKLVNTDVNVNLSGDDVLKLKLIGTDTNTYIYVPDLIAGYFMLPNEDFANKLANSELGQAMGIDASQVGDIDIDYFDIPTEVADESEDVTDDFWDKCEVEKDGKKTVSVNGKSVKAKKYVVTIPKDEILDAVENSSGDLLDSYASQYGMSTSDIRTALSTFLGGDIVADVYVSDGKVVKIECKSDSGMVNYDFWLDYDNDEVAGALTISMMGEQISAKFDIKDLEGNPNGTVNVSAPGQIIDASFDSVVVDKDNEKGADINVEVKYNSETMFKGSVSFNENLSNKQASDIDSSVKVYDVCSMSQNDFMTVVSENMYSINEWMTKMSQNPILSGIIGGLAGDLGMDDIEDIDDIDDDDDDYDDDYDDDIDVGDMTLETYDGNKVQILGTLDGFECDYASQYSVDFSDDSYDTSIDYELETNSWYDSAAAVAEEMYIPEDSDYSTYEFVEQEIGASLDFEDSTVYYSKIHYIETSDGGWTSEVCRYLFVREVADGVYLEAEVYIYPDSAWFNASPEELAQVLSSSYYSVIE